MNIFVGNLSWQITQEEIQNAFAAYGEVASVYLPIDRSSGRPRGIGFVEMPDDNQAKAAIAALHTAELNGRAMTVNEARPREARPFGGGSSRRDW
jgi:cold-inducible RNA-binding protein